MREWTSELGRVFMTTANTLYILDGSYYVFRAFYALRALSNSKGMPTNGLYAFTSMLLNVIRDQRPSHLIVTFDPPGDTFRHELYAPYKANRESPPDELRVQMPHFRRIVKALNIPCIEVPGFEADDVIGTLVRSPLREGKQVVVLTGDKDLYQLVDDATILEDSMRGKRVDIAAVLERFQVAPERVSDVLALSGDTSDNVPGVPGIGEKTAGKLIADFGSLEELLARTSEVSGAKRRENLETFADQARLSHTLVKIATDVPLTLDEADMALRPPDYAAFDALCAEFEFGRFPSAVREIFPRLGLEGEEERALSSGSAAAKAKPMDLNGDLFASVDAPSTAGELVGGGAPVRTSAGVVRDYRIVWTQEELAAMVEELRSHRRFAFDLETTSLNPLDATIVGLSCAAVPGRSYYVPIAHLDMLAVGRQLPLEVVLEALRPLLEDPDFTVICQNGAYELRVLERAGVSLNAFRFDTMLAAWLLEPNRRRHGLDALAVEYLNETTILYSELCGTGKNAITFDQVPIESAAAYGAEDSDLTLRLADIFEPMLRAQGLDRLLTEIEVPLAHVLAKMESMGIRVDSSVLRELSLEFTARLEAIEQEIYALAGHEFLISSPMQLRVVLFEELELPVVKRTKTGPSTDQDVLEKLSEMHELPRKIVAYRHLAKLRSTYVDALPKLVHPNTGRVHTSFNQAVAATGRLSSSDPNLQNIPIRSEDGRRIRRAFIPEEGWVLLAGDYSQIELRMLAHMSGDAVLIDAFQKGEDIHQRTASEVFGVPISDVTSDQRAAAKAINFGLLYGMGARRLSQELGISNADAARYIEQYFERIAGVKPFLDTLVSAAQESGFAQTIAGRRRPIPELSSGQKMMQAMGERLAMNTPIQGSAADLIKIAMIRIQTRLAAEKFRARMLLQVHDELVFEAPPEEVDRVEALAREEMEAVWELSVPLVVEFERGPNWAELQ